MPIDITQLVASPGYAPREWQSAAPAATYPGGKPPVEESSEIDRILALPTRPLPHEIPGREQALVQIMTERFRRDNPACECAARWNTKCRDTLWPVQAWALYEMGLIGGVLGMIGVGWGKTLIDLLAPIAIGAKTAVLHVPPNLVDQLCDEYLLYGQHFRMPQLIVHGRQFTALAGNNPACDWPGVPTTHVMPYSLLSRDKATTFLSQIRPDVIIGDEADALSDPGATRTGRVLRYYDQAPTTKGVMMTGSITSDSLMDYAHLAAISLKEASPVPIDGAVTKDWCRAIDPAEYRAPIGALHRLMEPGESIYDALRRRLHGTLGVISTAVNSSPAVNVIEVRPVPDIPDVVTQALNDLRATWVRPDGEELLDALSVARCARELACGFFYYWHFPNGEPAVLVDEWLAKRKAWRRELRDKLKAKEEHLDSPLLCARAAMRAWGDDPNKVSALDADDVPDRLPDVELPVWKANHWPAWRDIRDAVKPVTRTQRLHPYLAEDAAAWGHDYKGPIWYDSRAFGEWVAEIGEFTLHGGGPGAGERLGLERGKRSIVASIKSHGRGRNGLQDIFAEQLIAQTPASASLMEQLLGRLCRPGQKARAVMGWLYAHTIEMQAAVVQVTRRAAYVERTTGQPQKILEGLRLDAATIAAESENLHGLE